MADGIPTGDQVRAAARDVREFAAGGARRETVFRTYAAEGRDAVVRLLGLLESERTRRDIAYRLSGIGIIAMVAVVALAGAWSMRHRYPSPLVVIPVFGILALLLKLAGTWLPTRVERACKALLVLLPATRSEPAALGPVLEVVGEYVDPVLHEASACTAATLLRDASDRGLRSLRPPQVVGFKRILSRAVFVKTAQPWIDGPQWEADLVLAALARSHVIGGQDVLWSVRHIAGTPVTTEQGRAVVDAANQAAKRLAASGPASRR